MIKVYRPHPRWSDMRHHHKLDLWKQYEDLADMVSNTGNESKFNDIEDEMMIWLEENCIDEILYDEEMRFYFKNTDDRLTFKLVWG